MGWGGSTIQSPSEIVRTRPKIWRAGCALATQRDSRTSHTCTTSSILIVTVVIRVSIMEFLWIPVEFRPLFSQISCNVSRLEFTLGTTPATTKSTQSPAVNATSGDAAGWSTWRSAFRSARAPSVPPLDIDRAVARTESLTLCVTLTRKFCYHKPAGATSTP